MDNTAELVERLEKATGPSYALECDIAKYVGVFSVTKHVPNYTASIDAALTLGGSEEEALLVLWGALDFLRSRGVEITKWRVIRAVLIGFLRALHHKEQS